MKRVALLCWLVAVVVASSSAWSQEKVKSAAKPPKPSAATKKPVPPGDDYPSGPDSQRQPGVPSGKTFQFSFAESKIFPGTTRAITVYVPAQYKADKPACVYIGLDHLGFEAPVVFDNLIHKQEMPLVIGVGISPGQVSSGGASSDPRFNRSFEFDGLNGNLARCVLEEILPEVEKRQTPDGLPIRLSSDPNDRCTGGGSTGGIAAFTLAWERPDAFRRVFTAIGTFVGMRGGDRYPVLIRKTETKPLRIFMQDGENDQWGGGPEVGDWWNSNQGVERALKFAGYQVEHVWGHGVHSARHATAIFPDAMRWLWKDWPAPIQAGESQNLFSKAILAPGEDWQPVAGQRAALDGLACDRHGDVYFRDGADRKIHKISDQGKTGEVPAIGSGEGPLAFGPDGRLYVADSSAATITAYDPAGDFAGRTKTIATGLRARDIVVTHGGDLYVTERAATGSAATEPAGDVSARGDSARDDSPAGKLWLIRSSGEKTIVGEGLNRPSGVAISPDGLWLAVAEHRTHWGHSYRVLPDGGLDAQQKFYWFHVPDSADDSGAGSWRMDRDGRLYAATRMGVQVFDRNGRSRCILPTPGGAARDVCFGGEKFDVLYVISGGKLFRRKIKTTGSPPWSPPTPLPQARPG